MDTPKTQSDDNTERMLEEMRGKASKLIAKEDELVKKQSSNSSIRSYLI